MSDEEPTPVSVDPVAKRGRGRPPGPPKPPKEKKPRGRKPGVKKEVTHAPYQKLVENALDDIYEKGGVSKRAIVKHIMDNEPECQDKLSVQKRVKTVLKNLIAKEILVAPNGAVGKLRRIDDQGSRGRPKGTKNGEAKEKKTPKKKTVIKVALKQKSSAKKRGRPKKSAEGKSPAAGEKKRGRPKKSAEGKSPGKPKKTAAAGTPGKKGRGRPKKQ